MVVEVVVVVQPHRLEPAVAMAAMPLVLAAEEEEEAPYLPQQGLAAMVGQAHPES
jgi:hypothetical protein